ncbi:MAG: hypothetical protein JSS02_22600 [Planctomycetes bacterium]|nr:hypothetical protein [Planctomycetota bacterium]
MRYRAEASSVEGFVQQLACCYLTHGYWLYVTGWIPQGKDAHAIDDKLIRKYGIDVSESTRARRKRAGQANLQYLRHGRLFVILATKGEHRFFDDEAKMIRDFRRVPLKIAGYSISVRRGGRTREGKQDDRMHAHVQIERERFQQETAYLLQFSREREPDRLQRELSLVPFEPYAPVRRQMLSLLRTVNRERKKLGLGEIPPTVLRLRRRVIKPFACRPVLEAAAKELTGPMSL